MNELPDSSVIWDATGESFISHSIQNTEMCCVNRKQKAGCRTADRTLKGHQSDTGLANQFADSIRRKSDYKPLAGHAMSEYSSSWPMNTLKALYASLSHISHSMVGFLCMYPVAISARFYK